VLDLLIAIFGFFLYPFATHDFIMKVSKILFIGRTKLDGIFFSNPRLKDDWEIKKLARMKDRVETMPEEI
jgi:hypothetical protein